MSELETSLLKDGYIILKNVISPSDVAFAKNQIIGNEVNYTGMTSFINNVVFNKLNRYLDWNPKNIKYRVSNNNNSADASLFHRDIVCQGRQLTTIPCFTCLTYLDKTVMELIPSSHYHHVMTTPEAIKNLFQTVKITMEEGDLLVFYSTLLHRGIFTENLPNRRLIQVFDVFPNIESYNIFSKRIIHLKSSEIGGEFMITLSKIPVIADIANFIGYLNSATGYGWSQKYNILSRCGVSLDTDFVSSEGTQGRISGDGIGEINKYIIMDESSLVFPEKCASLYKHRAYTEYYTDAMIKLVFIIVLVYLAFKLYKNKKLTSL
jgi:hypothetical protein